MEKFSGDFFQRETPRAIISKEKLLEWLFPKRNFSSDYFQREIPQAIISKEKLLE